MIGALIRVLGEKHARPVKAAIALMALTAIVEGASYAFLLPVLEELLGPAPAETWAWLWVFATVIGIYALLRYVSDVVGFRVTTGLLRSMYQRFGDHLVRLPVGWFSQQRAGKISVLVSQGILDSLGTIAHILTPYLSACLTPLTIVIVILSIDMPLGLVTLAVAPLIFWVLRWSKRSMAALDDRRRAQEHAATDRTVEFLRAQPLLRAAGRSLKRYGHLENSLHNAYRTVRRLLRAVVPANLGAAALIQAAFTAVLLISAVRAVSGDISVVEAIVILILVSRCVDPVMELSEMSAEIRGAEATLAELEGVLEVAPLSEPAQAKLPERTDVEFDSVSWRSQNRTVIDQMSLKIDEGQRVAIVGPSGAGKSTVLNLIARFHDVDTGAVRIGGVNVCDMTAQALSSQIAFVFQDVFLFDATIEENIRMARPDASQDEVRKAATAARLDEVAARLPQGWQAPVGEDGRLLSGGERQRVSIARAILKDAPIILLDELSSSLDPLNEAAVHDSLRELTRNRTTVIVTHRIHTILHADNIVFLDRGRIVESGTHDELTARNGRYSEFLHAVEPPENLARKESPA